MSLPDFFWWVCQEIKLFFSTGPDGVGIVPIPVPAPALQGPEWVTTIDLSKWVVQHGTFKDCETFGNFEDKIIVSDFIERPPEMLTDLCSCAVLTPKIRIDFKIL